MEEYIIKENDFYQILIPKSLKNYFVTILEQASLKMKEFLSFFNKETYGMKIKASFLISRDDFIKRIKEVSPNSNPPSWASGCFYGGEIQILLNKDKLDRAFSNLVHESFHLLFQKFIYKEYNIERIVWLDESLAGNFDDTTQKLIDSGEFLNIINNLKDNNELPTMNDLDFSKDNIKTDKYNGYDLFKIVGRYLIETKKENLLSYIKDKDRVIEDGNTILDKSINYFLDKMNNAI